RSSIDRGELAEHLAGRQLAKAHRLADRGIDRHAHLAEYDEEHVVGLVEVVENWLSRRVALPGTTTQDSVKHSDGEPRRDADAFQRLLRLRACESAIANPRACTVQSARSINQATANRHTEKSHRLGQRPGDGPICRVANLTARMAA